MARQTAIRLSSTVSTLVLLLALTAAPSAWAGWATFGTPASLADSNQVLPLSISDGAGGIFVVWEDYRNGDADVYAQHLDASGNALWTANGVPVIVHTGNQESPVLARDGAGGIIVAWQDSRSGLYDIYGQSLDASGAPRWAASGAPICTAAGLQVLQVATTDASGGAIIGWRDTRSGGSDIYAQRVNGAGAPLWTVDGVAVCDTINTQTEVRILPDQLGGAFLLWRDRRSGPFASNDDIYAQRLNAAGVPQWIKNGVPVATASGAQFSAEIVGDGRFGFVAVWVDQRGATDDLYAQRILPDGSPKWAVNGVLVTGAAGAQGLPLITGDAGAGALIAWTDARTPGNVDIFAQAIDSLGTRKWAPADGVAVCASDSTQAASTIVSDGLGGAIVGWEDGRAGFREIYAQHLNASGATLWEPLGLLIATGAGQRTLRSAAPDGFGGCLFVWEDFRSGPNTDVYAYRVTSVGTGIGAPPVPPASARLFPARPNPFNPHTTLSFQLDQPGPVRLALYDLQGRLVRELARGEHASGRHDVAWDGTDDHGRACASGVYFVQLSTARERRRTTVTLLR